MTLQVFIANLTAYVTDDKKHRHLIDQSGHYTELNTINWRDTTQFDSEDDYRTGCRNVSHGQQ